MTPKSPRHRRSALHKSLLALLAASLLAGQAFAQAPVALPGLKPLPTDKDNPDAKPIIPGGPQAPKLDAPADARGNDQNTNTANVREWMTMAKDPIQLFDFAEIQNTPLDAKTIKTQEKDGVIVEHVEYTSRTVFGRVERMQGIMAYPKGAIKKPAVFWSQSGMAPAGDYFPILYAKKGYVCLCITLDHKLRKSFEPFDTRFPAEANLTLLARDQMRGITLLTQRPEVDPNTIGVAGASYGGFFANVIAANDPRVKAGAAYFSGANHALGTNMPQFTGLKNASEVEIWNASIDPADKLAKLKVPFLWACAFDDHWFHFPALSKTYADAQSPEKRLIVAGTWKHGFPEFIDNQINDFLDTTLTKTAPPYLQPGTLTVTPDASSRLQVSFPVTGTRPIAKAEILVSPGKAVNWIGWSLRASTTIPAKVDGNKITATIPIPSFATSYVLVGQVYDDKGHLTSTVPVIHTYTDKSPAPTPKAPDPSWTFNCIPVDDFSAASVEFFTRLGYAMPGVLDDQVKAGATASRRFDKPGSFTYPFLYNVPGDAHKLSLKIKSEKPQVVQVVLKPLPPQNWQSDAVRSQVPDKALVKKYNAKPAEIVFQAQTTGDFKEFNFTVPADAWPIEGYDLIFRTPEKTSEKPGEKFWIDQLKFQPIWE
jgi:dienelactone hydrolase